VRDATARAVVGAVLGRTRGGEIEVVENGRSRVFGRPSELRATVRINDPAAWRGPLNGSIGLGESYVDGLWETDDLVALIQIADRSLSRQHRGLSAAVARSRAAFHRVRGLVPENTKGGARANISAHYDLGNDLFSSFLDPTMMYSCAYFPREDATLEEAQLAKLDRICERLQLGPDTHLLEIGTGWGGMAIHAARTAGCRVTTTTISRAQHELATERVREAGLEDRITILLEDYRDLRGTYDRLVSIEMIEAVGWQYFDTYFEACDRLLADDGLFLLQAIIIDDRLYETEKASKSFANTHVFPGGCLPSLKRIADSIGSVTTMREIGLDDITAHYPPTLADWRARFFAAWDGLKTHGYDERFKRLWDFYLSGSEAGFRERRIGDVQVLFAKPSFR
jgi:cyclopropane-fatty-acyl-phospholipid synthase